MTTLVFVFAIAAIALGILALEGESLRMQRPIGLLTWLVSGNWPAKVGGGFMVLGVGALLRYAAIHVDVPPVLKLSAGVGIAGLLGFAAAMTGSGAARRAVSLALGGSAFGVAYLTAYTAFALYGFVSDATGLALLAATAIATGVYAVTRNALSVAILAMVGAWLGPTFAVTDPGPVTTYGYYIAASTLTMLMVAVRGWRPLIHLSFLFTLAGSVFLTWNASYLSPEHYDVMSPMLLILSALHVAMPLVERGPPRSGWILRFDWGYTVALPLTAGLFAIAIAPDSAELSALLIPLGALWLLAALYLRAVGRENAFVHLLIGGIGILTGVATRWQALPWDVIALGFAVAMLELATRTSQSKMLHNLLAGSVLLAAAIHALVSLDSPSSQAFLNAQIYEQLAAAGLLVVASRSCRRVGQALDETMFYVGLGWAVLTLGIEIVRFDVVSIALVAHWMTLAIVVFLAVRAARVPMSTSLATLLTIAVLISAAVAAPEAPLPAALLTLIAAPLTLIALATRKPDPGAVYADRIVATMTVPVVAGLWGQCIGDPGTSANGYAMLAAASAAAVFAMLSARFSPVNSGGWAALVSRLFGFVFACALLTVTALHISREGAALFAEAVLWLGLIAVASIEGEEQKQRLWRPVAIIGAALVLQAHMLRWFGPSGELTLADLSRMQAPTLVSLLWAAMGATLTLWGRRRGSRSWWASGAALLVGAAIKLVVVDIGVRLDSLGDLTNIVAVIAAGGVFMLVGWLAPMPPGADRREGTDAESMP